MDCARIFISGFVHGVGFRYFVKGKARELGLVGWVRNLPDGVEAIFQGKKEKIEKMIGACNEGPPFSEVKEVQVFWEKSKEIFSDFQILR